MNTTDKLAQALRVALSTLELIRPRGVLANDASIADFMPSNFGLGRIRAALTEYDAQADAYIVLQEGGSSVEGPYISSWSSWGEAEDHRRDCAKGAYRTSPPIKVPAALAAHGEALYELLEEVVGAEFEYASNDEEEGEAS